MACLHQPVLAMFEPYLLIRHKSVRKTVFVPCLCRRTVLPLCHELPQGFEMLWYWYKAVHQLTCTQ
jgi:hypothetical protein